MIWENVLDKDLLTIKLDPKDKSAILEINDGGISPNYVTIRLQEQEIGELISALERIQRSIKRV